MTVLTNLKHGPVLDMPTKSHLHHRYHLCYLFPLPVWEKFSSLIPGPILCFQGHSPSSPFFHDVILIVWDWEPISGPQSGSLINHYILGSSEPSRMLHATVLFCSLTRMHCFREHRRASVTCAPYPLGYPAPSKCMASYPGQLKLSFRDRLPQSFFLLWNNILHTQKKDFFQLTPSVETTCLFFFLHWL